MIAYWIKTFIIALIDLFLEEKSSSPMLYLLLEVIEGPQLNL